MTDRDDFSTLAGEFETLQKHFENASDPAERKLLLGELRGKLRQIEKLVNRHLDEFGRTSDLIH